MAVLAGTALAGGPAEGGLMAIKLTVQGLLIYATMAAYAAAFVLLVAGCRRSGWAAYAAAFAAAVVSYTYRWVHAGHVPMQTVFEIMLLMGVLMAPLAACCRRWLDVGLAWADAVVALAFLLPAGFVLSEAPQKLPPALGSPLFVPHVLAYVLAYAIMAKATVQAAAQLVAGRQAGKSAAYEEAAYRMVCLAFPLLTAGLVLGAWWGRMAWTRHWGWDPKESWSLASWLAVLVYFHFRSLTRRSRPNINAAMVIVAMVLMILTLVWVNFARIFAGLHSYAT